MAPGGVSGWRTSEGTIAAIACRLACLQPARQPLSGLSMSEFQSSLLRLLDERGYIHQATDAAALDALASREVVPGYIGFDATAPSLHVGSLVQIMMLRRLQQAGHKPIVLMGGGTTKIGDPSGKDESRKLLTDERSRPISPRSAGCSSIS